ncbi:enoyl-CoA hydratase/isomerase family protein [Tardiphaga robiniae]|nr:enoyl-CoA hydratase/isomerase family protein [Tardiphaga robiniae]
MTRYSHYTRLAISSPAPGVMKVELNRPDKYNATDEAMHHELTTIWRDIDADPDASVSILTGVGNVFSAGGDFSAIEENINDPRQRLAHWRGSRDLVYNIINSSKPIVSAIRGPAVGAGLTAALLADVSIASRTARIIDGHTRLGVVAGDHAAIIWPLLCGMAKAKYLLLLCEPVSGEEAERLGLISLAVDDDQLEAKSLEIAVRLANGAPTAIRLTKYALNNWLRSAGPIFDTSLALEFLSFTGSEVQEGLKSHLEKRKPNFDRKSPI